ncbi:hypothetical protein Emed_001324 [Eimeria media]
MRDDFGSISQQTPTEKEEADDLPEGFSDISEDAAIEAFAAEPSQGPLEPEGALETKGLFLKRLPFWGVFATVVSALLLAMILRKRLDAFEKPKVEPPELLREHEEKLMEASHEPKGEHAGSQEGFENELVKASDKPTVESTKPPGGVPQEKLKEALEKPKEDVLPPEFQQTLANLAEWVRRMRAPEHETLQLPDLEDEKFEAILVRGGVRYILRAYFMRLTPAYDPEKTAAILLDGVTKLLKECSRNEQNVHTRDVFCTPSAVFGDVQNAQVFVVLACECASSKMLDAALRSALLN